MELELVDGDRELFDAVDARLREAGLQVAGTGSKLARVLPVHVPHPRRPPSSGTSRNRRPRRRSPLPGPPTAS